MIQVINGQPALDTNKYPARKFGTARFTIKFDPRVKGLPKDMQKNFDFVVTETGYMLPSHNDTCLERIYDNDWVTTAKLLQDQDSRYNNTAACMHTSSN